MAKNLFIVTIRWVTTPLTQENLLQIDNLLTGCGDWLRFSGTVWLLDTNKSAEQVFQVLGTFLKKDDSELIVRADLNDFSGWCQKWVNDWLQTKKKQI